MVTLTDKAIIIEIPTEFAYDELPKYQQALTNALTKIHPDIELNKEQIIRHNYFIGSLLSSMLLTDIHKLNPSPQD